MELKNCKIGILAYDQGLRRMLKTNTLSRFFISLHRKDVSRY